MSKTVFLFEIQVEAKFEIKKIEGGFALSWKTVISSLEYFPENVNFTCIS